MEDLAFEDFLLGQVGHLWLTTGSHCSHDAFEAPIGRVVDDPAALLVFVDGVDSRVEFGVMLEAVLLPEVGYLGDDLLAVWIAGVPLHRRKEAVHDAVDLKAAGIIDSLEGGLAWLSSIRERSVTDAPYSSQVLFVSCLKNSNIEAVADAMRSC